MDPEIFVLCQAHDYHLLIRNTVAQVWENKFHAYNVAPDQQMAALVQHDRKRSLLFTQVRATLDFTVYICNLKTPLFLSPIDMAPSEKTNKGTVTSVEQSQCVIKKRLRHVFSLKDQVVMNAKVEAAESYRPSPPVQWSSSPGVNHQCLHCLTVSVLIATVQM